MPQINIYINRNGLRDTDNKTCGCQSGERGSGSLTSQRKTIVYGMDRHQGHTV